MTDRDASAHPATTESATDPLFLQSRNTYQSLNADPVPGEKWILLADSGSDQRGGLGGDSAAAPGGGHAGAGDRPQAGDGPEHDGRALVSEGPPRYQRAVKGSTVDAAEPRIRGLLAEWPEMPATVIAERIGWDRSPTVLKVRGPGAAAAVRPAGSGVADGVPAW